MTLYIVSGNVRSGTSMMMRALHEGGLPAVYFEEKNTAPNEINPYHVANPHGFFELGEHQRVVRDYPDCYAGRVIKLIAGRLFADIAPVAGTPRRVIYMERPVAEIVVSYRVAFRRLPSQPMPPLQRDHGAAVKALRGLGYDVLHYRYHDVVADPLACFTAIAAAGWPIEPTAAAATVDPSLYRIKGPLVDRVPESVA